jgi:hypothetical protein
MMFERLAARCGVASGSIAGCCPRSQLELSLQPLTRAGRESYAVETMALCLDVRLLLLPRKGE